MKNFRKSGKKGIKKRMISIFMAVEMFISILPMSLFTDIMFFPAKGKAAEYTKYDISDYANIDEETGYVRISTWKELCDYSQAYYEATQGTYGDVSHKTDTILMAIADSASANLVEAGFEPIGNAAQPFEGRLLFETGSFDTFNLGTPLFGYVYDKVCIAENSDGTTPRQIKIGRIGDPSGEPLLAYKVLSDGDPETSADWSFVFQPFEAGADIKYAGAIGEIAAGAEVRLTMVNNAEQGRSPVETDSTGTKQVNEETVADPRPKDIGAICGMLGENAVLTVNYSGTNTDYRIKSEHGNAGGLVGSMGTGAVLNIQSGSVNLQGSDVLVRAGNGYAGGIVGHNNGGTVNVLTTDPYEIKQHIMGSAGSGGIFGYYTPASGEVELDISKYLLNCKVNVMVAGSGYSGGLIGVLENNGSALTVKGAEGTGTTVISSHVTTAEGGAKANCYGGVIGSYKAHELGDSLEVKDVQVKLSNSLEAETISGGIGKVIGASFVKFSGFTLLSAEDANKANTFGGLVATTDYGYIYSNGVYLGSAQQKISGFQGGSLVGNLGNGVLGMAGTVDLSNITPVADQENGQLVAKRDHALIYAESDWDYTPNAAEIDNVGSWGDVITFGPEFRKEDVFTESGHVITLGTVDPSGIQTVADYAKASLLFQIDVTKNSVIADSPGSLSDTTNFTFTDDLDLTNTGLRGITRDNGTTAIVSKGTIAGTDGKVLILDIKNVGGSNRPVYRHQYNGLIAQAQGVTFQNLSLGGSISIHNKVDRDAYVGAAAATAKFGFYATNCNTVPGLDIRISGGKMYSGRFLGDALESSGTITVTGGVYDGSISGSGSLGGVIGFVNKPGSAADWTFDNVMLRGTISGNQSVGGLIAETRGGDQATIKLTGSENGAGVVADGIVVEGNNATSMGGLLGFNWLNTNVEVTKMSVSGTPIVRQKSSGGMAGLVYRATGHWLLGSLKLGYTDEESVSHAIKMEAGNAVSVGMIVNKGTYETTNEKHAIYLEVPVGSYQLALDGGSAFKSGVVFDEICAYSASDKNDIMKNGQGIISIHTAGLVMEKRNTAGEGEPESLSFTDSLSYKNQTTQGAAENPYTRYYYNLSAVTKTKADYAALTNEEKAALSPQVKLMSWGLNQYAASNLKNYFADPFQGKMDEGNYDMKGYSWYPVTLDAPLVVKGNFTFYNEEFNKCEGNKIAVNKWSPLGANQHFMMQNGLLYDVNKNLTIKDVSLAGTIGALNGSQGTGALIYGVISGSKTNTSTNITTIDSTAGSILLDGIRVWNLDTLGANAYAPLLINQASSYVTMKISNVSNTAAYLNTENHTTINAATSLIGKAGNSNTSEYVKVEFTKIKLDGRRGENDPSDMDADYKTTKSIFTSATLLEQLQYKAGGAGTYIYSFEEDWGTSTVNSATVINHKVTYGKEVGYTAENNSSTQYPGLENMYSGEKASGKNRYTRPDNAPADSGSTLYTNFGKFLPYVKNVSTKEQIANGTGTLYQLQVNHQAETKLEGCGTYNDPYQIKSAADLGKVSRWIRGGFNSDEEINIPYGGVTATWCNDKETPDHKAYKFESGNFVLLTDSSKTLGKTVIQEYLAGAYYVFPAGTADITLSSSATPDFNGLGSIADEQYRFRGVIIGNGITINNATNYPLINCSNGSVVKDLSITVTTDITLPEAKETYPFPDYNSGKPRVYGAVIGQILGGDNILDNVQVDFGEKKITIVGKYSQYVPVGGYVGVILNGGVVFRNMAGNVSGLQNKNVVTTSTETAQEYRTNLVSDDNTAWLFANPVIGRVINGYAVTETNEYVADSSLAVMKNGTKNYAITDIKSAWLKNEENELILSDGEKLNVTLSNNKYTAAIPNAQSFLVLSIIVNSGMGILDSSNTSSATKQLGYYLGYFTTRHAEYSDVGTNDPASDCVDYQTYAKKDFYWGKSGASDTDKKNDMPYLISKYSNANAKVLGKKTCTINLTANGKYVLPDGYRGIGNFFHNDDAYRLNVTTFNGNNSEIQLNTKYLYYNNDFDGKYMPDSNGNKNGIGLFCSQQESGTYQNFTLKGNVISDAIDHKTGKHIVYTYNKTNPVWQRYYSYGYTLSAGMLFGESDKKKTITNVCLKDIHVRSVRNAGGLIGMSMSGDITIKGNTKDSEGITVHSGSSAGGLIGFQYQDKLTIDFNNNKFKIREVVSETKSILTYDISGSDEGTRSYYCYGVGGLVGTFRSGIKTESSKIQNIIVENDINGELAKITSSIEATTNEGGGGLCTGGLIGTLNKPYVTIENCVIRNVSCTTNAYAGGVLGWMTSSVGATIIKDTKVECTIDGMKGMINGGEMTNATILTSSPKTEGLNAGAGGLIGYTSGDTPLALTVKGCSIRNYIISAQNDVGGVIGGRNDMKDNANSPMQLEDFSISDCTLKGDTRVGGIIGYQVKYEFRGYNILADNLTFAPYTENATTSYLGYIIGFRNAKVDDKTDSTSLKIKTTMKIVGFSRIDVKELGSQKLVGNFSDDSAARFGKNGYVIFADYNGVISNTGHVTDVDIVTNKENVAAALPYVTVNPKIELDAGSTPKYITSDAASTVAVSKILTDIRATNHGYYATAASVVDALSEKISSFKEEMGTKTLNIGDRDFPVLIIDDIDKPNTTNRINNYIALLTNTVPGEYNYAEYGANTDLFRTVVHKCTYDEEGKILTIGAGDADEISGGSTASNSIPCLKRNGTQFYMNANDTDTAAGNAQFTLLDVQYLDPSGTGKIVYHLYVPVYVRKVVEFDFNVHVESGTNYMVKSPQSILKNTLVENIGVPVTFEFAYTYNRTSDEWKAAVNGGDSLLGNYPKTLLFANSSALINGVRPNLPADTTKMVLIDTQNYSKAYYLDELNSAAFGGTDSEKKLDLSKFVNGSDYFSPVSFNDMMIIVVEQNNAGTLVCSADHASNTYSDIVVDNSSGPNNGKVFRYSPSDETGIDPSDRYTVKSLRFKNGGEKLVEHYFLSVYTAFSNEAPVYHYAVSSGKNLGTVPFPSRITKSSENNAANLFLGYIYDQHVFIDSLKVNEDENLFCINSENNQLSAQLRATIQLTASAVDNGIKTYLGSTNPPGIYESLMLQFDKYTATESVIGIKGVNDVEITSYKINNSTVSNYDSVTTASYIELRNNESLAKKLRNETVVIEAAVTVSFDTENGGIQEQFYPQSPDTRGTKVIASSKIASSSSQTAYSKISISTDKLWDPVHNCEGRTNRYYTDDKEKVTLAYDPLEIPQEGQIPQLGVNADDPKDATKLPAPIKTLGTYDLEKCQRTWNDSEYVRVEIELRSIDDEYVNSLEIFKYLDEETFSVFGGVTPDKTNSSATKLVYVYKKAALSSYYKDKAYHIPIDFQVISGSDFEDDNLKYANYAIYLNVSLLDPDKNVMASSVPARSDYVKFTNAKIYINKVDPDKEGN